MMANNEPDFMTDAERDKKVKKIEVTIESSTKSAIRTAIAAARVCEDKQRLLNGQDIELTGAISMVFKPSGTTFGGHGEVFKKFKETGILSGYPGEGREVAVSLDPNYKDAPLKLMEFHETFRNTKNDVDKNKYFRPAEDKVLRVIRGKRGKYKPRKKKADSSVELQAVEVPSQSATVSVSVQVSQYGGSTNEIKSMDNGNLCPEEGKDEYPKPLPLKKRKMPSSAMSSPLKETTDGQIIQDQNRKSKKAFNVANTKTDVHFGVQQESALPQSTLEEDEGYSGSQDKAKPICLEDCEEDNIMSNYFSENPSLNDCSFSIFCTQASAVTEVNDYIDLDNL